MGEMMGCTACEKARQLRNTQHLVQAVGRVAKAAINGKDIIASKETEKARLEQCEQCDKVSRFIDTGIGSTIGLRDTCLECGCNIRIKAKAATESCPLGKWAE